MKPSQLRKKAAVEEESKKENSAPPVEITEDIPDEVKPFVSLLYLLHFGRSVISIYRKYGCVLRVELLFL